MSSKLGQLAHDEGVGIFELEHLAQRGHHTLITVPDDARIVDRSEDGSAMLEEGTESKFLGFILELLLVFILGAEDGTAVVDSSGEVGVVLEEEEAKLAHVLGPDVTDAFFILGNGSVTATWKQEVVAQLALFHRLVNLDLVNWFFKGPV